MKISISGSKKRRALAPLSLVLCLLISCAEQAGLSEQSPAASEAEAKPSQTVVKVVTTHPRRETIDRTVVLPGSFEAFERTKLYSRVAGYLDWIGVDIGDRVRKGQVVARILVPEMEHERDASSARLSSARAMLENNQAELERAQAEYRFKKVTFERVSKVREQDSEVMSEQRVDEARQGFEVASTNLKVVQSQINLAKSKIKELEANLKHLDSLMAYTEIKAPFSGTVAERFVDPGSLIQEGTTSGNALPIVTIFRADPIRIFLDVPEKEVAYVQVGDPAFVTCDALPGKRFEGHIERFSRALNPATRTMRVQINHPNPQGILLPGMFGRVRLILDSRPDSIVIPVEALRSEGEDLFLYVVQEGKARRVEVETANNDLVYVEITSGLQGHEEIVVASSGSLSEGLAVSSSPWEWPQESRK